MSPLRQRLIEELQLHRKADSTIEAYLAAVADLAKFFHRSPDQLEVADVRKYLHHLIVERRLARNKAQTLFRLRDGPHRPQFGFLGVEREIGDVTRRFAGELSQQPDRNDHRSAQHDGRHCREISFLIQFGEPLLQPTGEFIGPLPRQAGIQLGVDLAREFLVLERRGPMIPVVDFLGEPVPHGRTRLVDEFFLAATHLAEMLGNEVDRGVLHRLGLQVTTNPRRRRTTCQACDFLVRRRAIVEVRRRPRILDAVVLVDFDELQPLGDDATVAGSIRAGILNGVFQIQQHTRLDTLVAVVDQEAPRLSKSR